MQPTARRLGESCERRKKPTVGERWATPAMPEFSRARAAKAEPCARLRQRLTGNRLRRGNRHLRFVFRRSVFGRARHDRRGY